MEGKQNKDGIMYPADVSRMAHLCFCAAMAMMAAFGDGAPRQTAVAERRILRVPSEAAALGESIGYWVVDSGRPGPVLAVVAEQHGNELSGVVSVRDFVRKAEREIVRGKVIGVPFMNPQAARRRMPSADLSACQPYIQSTHNMQTLWSSPDANGTARLADAIWNGILAQADCILDIHCYPKFCAPVAAVRDSPEGKALGAASGMRFVRAIPETDDWKGHIRTRACREGKLSLGIELSGQFETFPAEVSRGVTVAANTARHLGIFTGAPEPAPGGTLSPAGQRDVYAPAAGLFVKEDLRPGDYVEAGRRLGYVLVETTLEEVPVTAPVAGYLMRFAGRADCDVDLRDHSAYVFLDDLVAKILPAPKR